MKLPRPRDPCRLLLMIVLGMAGAGVLVSRALAMDAEQPFLVLNQTAMDRMMAGMSVKPTGNADADFVAMMVSHHQGAIDMAEAELRYGHNEKLLRISQEIVVQQQQEIAAMRLAIGESARATWVTSADPDGGPSAKRPGQSNDADFVDRSNAAMNKMMSEMTVKPTGDVDHDFVAMMVPHHQGAIDMAQAELRFGQNPTLKTIAQEIVVEQQQEIVLMRLALNESLPQSIASPTQPPTGGSQPEPTQDAARSPMEMSPGMQMSPPAQNK